MALPYPHIDQRRLYLDIDLFLFVDQYRERNQLPTGNQAGINLEEGLLVSDIRLWGNLGMAVNSEERHNRCSEIKFDRYGTMKVTRDYITPTLVADLDLDEAWILNGCGSMNDR